MAIYGIEGGIGCGKTLTLVYFLKQDLVKGKKIYTNIKLTNLGQFKHKVKYLDVKLIEQIFELIKTKKLIMSNSGVYLQELHNYVDSRNSMSKKNRVFTAWINQSRHTGEGSMDIYYDTQSLDQVDKRIRRNTDYLMQPKIIRTFDKKPELIRVKVFAKIGHKFRSWSHNIDVYGCLKNYDTHQVVEF